MRKKWQAKDRVINNYFNRGKVSHDHSIYFQLIKQLVTEQIIQPFYDLAAPNWIFIFR